MLAPCLAVAGLFLNTTDIARQDVSALIASASADNWAQAIERSPAGSTHAAQMAFTADSNVGSLATGAIAPFGANVPGMGPVVVAPAGNVKAALATPDEARVVRMGQDGPPGAHCAGVAAQGIFRRQRARPAGQPAALRPIRATGCHASRRGDRGRATRG
ncbi:MAG: hypothetical protein HC779_08120 [Phyllobacteriaceae bacterium]|nr:hypothetical protein [Phyllobacteriaceae bacterium]